MGLIRSGNTKLTPMSDEKDLTAYLWPIVRERIKTARENRQKDFASEYLKDIQILLKIVSMMKGVL